MVGACYRESRVEGCALSLPFLDPAWLFHGRDVYQVMQCTGVIAASGVLSQKKNGALFPQRPPQLPVRSSLAWLVVVSV
jgi:hypothetical protein